MWTWIWDLFLFVLPHGWARNSMWGKSLFSTQMLLHLESGLCWAVQSGNTMRALVDRNKQLIAIWGSFFELNLCEPFCKLWIGRHFSSVLTNFSQDTCTVWALQHICDILSTKCKILHLSKVCTDYVQLTNTVNDSLVLAPLGIYSLQAHK